MSYEPAFPSDGGYQSVTGLSMLDYFAAQIAGGIVAESNNYQYPQRVASNAYKIAQAMIEERKVYVGA